MNIIKCLLQLEYFITTSRQAMAISSSPEESAHLSQKFTLELLIDWKLVIWMRSGDLGYAPDYVVAMHAMLQQSIPEDFVVITGVVHSVRDFLKKAFSVIGLEYEPYIQTNPHHFRPSEKVPLCGDASKARHILKWNPTRTFDEIIETMEISDIKHIEGNR